MSATFEQQLNEARELIREMLDADRAYAEAGLSDEAACTRMMDAFRAARRYVESVGAKEQQ